MKILKIQDLGLENAKPTLSEIFLAAHDKAQEEKIDFQLDLADHYGLPENIPSIYNAFEYDFLPPLDPSITDRNLAHKILGANVAMALLLQENPITVMETILFGFSDSRLDGVLYCMEIFEIADSLYKPASELDTLLQDTTREVMERYNAEYAHPKLAAA